MIKYRDWSRLIQFLALLLTSCRRISGAHMGQQGSGWNKLAMSHHHLLDHNEVASCGEKWLGVAQLANLPCFNHQVGIVGTVCLAKCMQMVYQQAFVIVSTVAAFWEYPSGHGIDPKWKSLEPWHHRGWGSIADHNMWFDTWKDGSRGHHLDAR